MRKLLILLSMIGLVSFVPVSVGAMPSSGMGSLVGDSCDNADIPLSQDSICATDKSKDESVDGFLKNIINFLLWLVGILAVIMIIVSAIKFATSAGDSAKLTSAKKTLLYSVIGLAVAVLSFAIVNLVVNEASKTGAQRQMEQCKSDGGTWTKGKCVPKK